MKKFIFIFIFLLCWVSSVLFSLEYNNVSSFIINAIKDESYDINFSKNFSDEVKKFIDEYNMRLVFKEIRNKYGIPEECRNISFVNNMMICDLYFKDYILKLNISLNANGQIDKISFTSPAKRHFSSDSINEITGLKSILIQNIKNNKILFEYNKDRILEVSSAIKLYLMLALVDRENRLDKVVYTDKRFYSIPPYIVYMMPDSSPVTLHTLLFLMAGFSDNSATDHIIKYLGQKDIPLYLKKYGNSAYLKNKPFPTTLQLSLLLSSSTATEYLNSDTEKRYEILENLIYDYNSKNITLSQLTDRLLEAWKINNKIGYFASAFDICKLMRQIYYHKKKKLMLDILKTELKFLKLKTGEKYKYAGFKSGTKPGTVSLNWLIINRKDEPFCVSFTVNSTQTVSISDILPYATSLMDSYLK